MTEAKVLTYADDAALYSSSTTVSELRVEVDRGVKWMETHKLVLKRALLSGQLSVLQAVVSSHRRRRPVVRSNAAQTHFRKLQIVQRKAAGVVLHSAFPTGASWLKVDAELQVSLQMFRKTERRDSWRKSSFSRDFLTVS